jgi:hypothetical protein
MTHFEGLVEALEFGFEWERVGENWKLTGVWGKVGDCCLILERSSFIYLKTLCCRARE